MPQLKITELKSLKGKVNSIYLSKHIWFWISFMKINCGKILCVIGWDIQFIMCYFYLKTTAKVLTKAIWTVNSFLKHSYSELNFLAFCSAYVCLKHWMVLDLFFYFLCITKQFHKQIIAWNIFGIYALSFLNQSVT